MTSFSPTLRFRHFVACLAVSGVGLSGCSWIPTPPRAPVAPPKSEVSAARSRSLERAWSGVNADTMRAWVNRYSAPKGAQTSETKPRAIYVNVDALARRHAAWLLADALQNGALSPTQAQQIRVSLPRARANVSPAKDPKNPVAAPGELPLRAGTIVTARESNNTAIQNSRATLDDFLKDLRARQTELELAQDELARRALEDRIRAATRGAVEAIELTPVSPETALELSNLRLQLLAQLKVPVAQKAAATAKIEAIEKRLNEIWSAQTAEQAAKLRAALEELPARLRREGLVGLQEAAARREAQRASASAELRRVVETRLRGAAPENSSQILRLFLPPARLPNANTSASFQTQSPDFSSSPAVENQVAVPGARALSQRTALAPDEIARLRAQARRDARQWARSWALQQGAQWSDKPGVPDRTAQAVTTLFSGAS